MLKHIPDSRYIPLALLEDAGGQLPNTDLMNHTISLSGLDVLKVRVLLNAMRGQGLISGPSSVSSLVRLEQSGAELLLSLQRAEAERLQLSEKEAKQASKRERQQRFDNKLAVATLLVQLISFLVGVLVEHYAKIFDFVSALFD